MRPTIRGAAGDDTGLPDTGRAAGEVRVDGRTPAPVRTVVRAEERAVLAKVVVIVTLQSLWAPQSAVTERVFYCNITPVAARMEQLFEACSSEPFTPFQRAPLTVSDRVRRYDSMQDDTPTIFVEHLFACSLGCRHG